MSNTHAGPSLKPHKNLSDVADAATSRANLGLGGAAVLPDPIPWANVDKAGSQLTDIGGTLDDGQLSANVPLLDAASNHFTNDMTVDGTLTVGVLAANTSTEDKIFTVNRSTAQDTPVPSGISGLAVDRGDVGGVERDRAGVYWDEASSRWKTAFDTAGDEATISSLADLEVKDLTVSAVTATTLSGNGASVTDIDAANVTTGTLDDARLSANVTVQGNTFNGVSQLVQLDGSAKYPNNDGSAITSLDATNITAGSLDDARLSANVPLLDAATNTFTGDLEAASFTGDVDWSNLINMPVTGGVSFDAGLVYHVNKESPDAEDSPRTGWSETDPRKPWATIQAAIAAAKTAFTGDSKPRLLVVCPASYDETITLESGVSLHLLPGVTISKSVSGNTVVVDPTKFAASAGCDITGHGVINSAAGHSIYGSADFSSIHASARLRVFVKSIGSVSLTDSAVSNKTFLELHSETSVGAITLSGITATSISAGTYSNISILASAEASIRGRTPGGTTGEITVSAEDSLGSPSILNVESCLAIQGMQLIDDGDDYGCRVSLRDCSVYTLVASESAIRLNGCGAQSKLSLQNVRLVSDVGATSAIANLNVSDSAVIKAYSYFTNKQLLASGLSNVIDSPVEVIDDEVEL